MARTLLEIDELSVRLPASMDRPEAVSGISLNVGGDEIVCVVGESGSGKSVLAQSVMGILPEGLEVTTGRIRFDGMNLLEASERQRRALRGNRMAMVFQEPLSALNPVMTVGDQIAEVFRYHGEGTGDLRARVVDLLAAVQLPTPDELYDVYPFRLSGGQRQRVVIAMALALRPTLLIADEPTTALDVTTQAEILALLRKLQREREMAVLFITHDFGVVADIGDRVAVMNKGRIVEIGETAKILRSPQDAYTRRLIAAIPQFGQGRAVPRAPEIVLSIRGLNKTYPGRGRLFKKRRDVQAIRAVDLEIGKGETLGLVGESGSGKSSVGRCVMRLIAPDSGKIEILGRNIAELDQPGRAWYRATTQMVFQDPFASLNPRHKIRDIIGTGMRIAGLDGKAIDSRVGQLLELVGLPKHSGDRYPHEFSGGQRQRIGIARAIAMNPRLLVADEPVSALDVSVQAQILALLRRLKEELSLSMLFITHDLRVASELCDRVAVMRQGEIVEIGAVGDVFERPQHEYTRKLLAAVPGRSLPLLTN